MLRPRRRNPRYEYCLIMKHSPFESRLTFYFLILVRIGIFFWKKLKGFRHCMKIERYISVSIAQVSRQNFFRDTNVYKLTQQMKEPGIQITCSCKTIKISAICRYNQYQLLDQRLISRFWSTSSNRVTHFLHAQMLLQNVTYPHHQ